jgi:hypothetical protein
VGDDCFQSDGAGEKEKKKFLMRKNGLKKWKVEEV